MDPTLSQPAEVLTAPGIAAGQRVELQVPTFYLVETFTDHGESTYNQIDDPLKVGTILIATGTTSNYGFSIFVSIDHLGIHIPWGVSFRECNETEVS